MQLGVNQALSSTRALTINPGGTLARGGYNMTSSSLTLNSGTISGAGTFTLGADITTTGGLFTGGVTDLGGGAPRTITIPSGTLTIADQITNGSLTLSGTGTLVLANLTGTASNYSAITVGAAGTLQLAAANQLPAGGTVTINSGATLNLGGFNTSMGLLTLNNGTVLAGSGTPTLTATGGITSDGISRITGGTLNIGPGTSYTYTVNSGTLTVDDSISGSSTSGAGGIIMNGSGILVLTNTGNAFNGAYSHSFNAGTVVNGASEVLGGHILGAGTNMPTLNMTGTAAWNLNGFYQATFGLSGAAGNTIGPERWHVGHPGLRVADRLQRHDGRQQHGGHLLINLPGTGGAGVQQSCQRGRKPLHPPGRQRGRRRQRDRRQR